MTNILKLVSFVIVIMTVNGCGKSSETADHSSDNNVAASEIETNPIHDVYWGDTHLHTDLSMDAGAFGNRIGMDEAYRFARGEEVTSSTGIKAKLSRPLDFLVVADHSDGMGLFPAIVNQEDWIMKTPEGKRWRKLYEEEKNSEMRNP